MATYSNHYSKQGFRKNELTPLRVLWDNNLFKVPVIVNDDGHYSIYINSDSQRIYTTDTLPNFIKARLTMVKAQYEGDTDISAPDTWVEVYDSSYIKSDIGRYLGKFEDNELLYVLVMNKQELDSLHGETLNKENK